MPESCINRLQHRAHFTNALRVKDLDAMVGRADLKREYWHLLLLWLVFNFFSFFFFFFLLVLDIPFIALLGIRTPPVGEPVFDYTGRPCLRTHI